MLTDRTIENLIPRKRAYKIYDHSGLYLHVHPNGKRYWYFRYQFDGKRRALPLGLYPTVTVVQARTLCAQMKLQRHRGLDLQAIIQQTRFLLEEVPYSDENIAEAVRIAATKTRVYAESPASLEGRLSALEQQVENLTAIVTRLVDALRLGLPDR